MLRHTVCTRERNSERGRDIEHGRKALWEHERLQQIFNCLLAKSLTSICMDVNQ